MEVFKRVSTNSLTFMEVMRTLMFPNCPTTGSGRAGHFGQVDGG